MRSNARFIYLGFLISFMVAGVSGQASRSTSVRPRSEGPPALVLNCSNQAGPAQVGVYYTNTCTASGGTPPYAFSMTGQVPAGIGSSTGTNFITVSGTPAQTGSYEYIVTARDYPSEFQSASVSFYGTISPATTLSAQPALIDFGQYLIGSAAPAPRSVSITSANPSSGVPFSINAGADCAWVGAGGGNTTPASLNISVIPANLTQGQHNCTISLNAGNAATTFSVAINAVSPAAPALAISPGLIDFGTFRPGSTAPSPRSVFVTTTNNAAGVPFTTNAGAGCDWVALGGPSATPAIVLVSASPGSLSEGPHSCTITFSTGNNSSGPTLVVSINVQAPQTTLNVTPAILDFGTYQPGNPPPTPKSFSVTNGTSTAPVNFLTAPGADCAWVGLNPASGATPTAVMVSVNPSAAPTGVRRCLISVGVQNGLADWSVTVTLTVNPASGLIISCTPGDGPVNAGFQYSTTCTALGGTAPYNWSINPGALPGGLRLDSPVGNTVTVRGTPSSLGPYSFTLTATDSSRPPLSASYLFNGTLSVAPGILTLVCQPAAGPTVLGVAYSTTCTVYNGAAPYNWSIVGSLPAGLQLSDSTTRVPTVTIRGAPATAGPYSFSLKVTDGTTPVAQAAAAEFGGSIAAPLLISCSASLGVPAVGMPFSITCKASRGQGPYSWTTNGTLPGLSATETTADTVTLSGSPKTAGPYSFSVTATDLTRPTPQTATQSFSGTIAPAPLTLTCTPRTGPTSLKVAYAASCSVSGGIPPYTTSVNGALPQGLSVTGSGTVSPGVSGTPTKPGPYSYTIAVSDSSVPVQSASQDFGGVVAGLIIRVTDLPGATAGSPYSANLTADSAGQTLTWSVAPNSLPTGLSLDPATGAVTGTPAQAGTFTVPVTASDEEPASDTATLTLTVGLPTAPTVDFSGLPAATTDPKQQLKWQFALKGSYPLPITVRLDLAFKPAGSLPDDPTVQFAQGGRTFTFTIDATHPAPVVMFQTGTENGSIVVSATLTTPVFANSKSTDQVISPSPSPSHPLGIDALAPIIETVTVTRSGSGFDVTVVGFSTPRQVTTAAFQFGGSNLQTSQLTPAVQSLFDNWYQSAASTQFGTEFTYTQRFEVQGTAANVTSVTVTLGNAKGNSAPKTVNF